MRRAPTIPSSSSSASPSGMERAGSTARQEMRIRVLEASLALEQHRREQLETKYAALKRRYARLERALQDASSGAIPVALDGRRAHSHSPTSSAGSTASAGSPPPVLEAVSAARSPVEGSDVIDLTSPVGSRRTSLAAPEATTRPSAPSSHPADDFIAESPVSPLDAADAARLRRGATTGSATRRTTRTATTSAASDPQPPLPPPPLATTALRVSGTRRRQLDFLTPDPVSRPRPRLGPNPAEERPSPARATLTSHMDHLPTARGRGTEERRRRRSPAQEETKSDGEPEGTTQVSATTDSDEAASIALAQYLQRQENLAAMREYENRLRALEYEQERERERAREAHRHHHHRHDDHRHAPAVPHGGGRLQDGAVDPDNMTYEELLQLGEQNGDVKKERWRQVAVQVLSRLPTHRWTTKSSDDVTCIICQYGFAVGDVALTLPCAHVFHEECVTGWVRENNSCPLCKLEIADV